MRVVCRCFLVGLVLMTLFMSFLALDSSTFKAATGASSNVVVSPTDLQAVKDVGSFVPWLNQSYVGVE